jgi:hypothetical protein
MKERKNGFIKARTLNSLLFVMQWHVFIGNASGVTF